MASNDYTSKSQEYQTPKEIYQPILDFIDEDKFGVDVCCSEDNIPAIWHLKKQANGYKMDWQHYNVCWMNPPWKYTKDWLQKAFSEVLKYNCEVWCCIPGDRLNTVFFNEFLNGNDYWFIAALTGKFNFHNAAASKEENEKNAKNGGLNTPVFILYIGKNADEYAKRWQHEQPIKSIVLRSM